MGRVSGKVSFVAGALPRERVEAECINHNRRFDEYQLVRVLVPSSQRVTPTCPLVGTCGGCDLQHLASAAQLEHKQRTVLELLKRQAGLTPEIIEAPITSTPFNYRRRARLAVQIPRKRGAALVLGFRAASSNRIVAVDHCPVLATPLAPLPGRLSEVLGRLQRPGAIGHVELMLSETLDDADVPVIYLRCVEFLSAADTELLTEMAVFEGAFLAVREGDADLRYLHAPDSDGPTYRLPEFDLSIGFQPGDFLQGNAAVNRALVSRLVGWLDSTPRGPLLDAFAGLGNFSLPVGRAGFQVVGMEAVASMVERASINARVNSVETAAFRICDLHDPAVPLPAEDWMAAVLDPPRQGAQQLVSELAARKVSSIVYVSCQPATLARDAAVLAGAGYRLDRLALVDMFPQTGHIETLALFVSDT